MGEEQNDVTVLYLCLRLYSNTFTNDLYINFKNLPRL